jgi:hypothetical protein
MKRFYIVSNGGRTMWANVIDTAITESLTRGDIIIIDTAENRYARRTRFGFIFWIGIKPMWVFEDKTPVPEIDDDSTPVKIQSRFGKFLKRLMARGDDAKIY